MASSEWSLPLGNWLGSRWRISWVLVTVCLIILTLSFWRSPTPADADLSVLGPIVVAMFAGSLLSRELIDWLLCRSLGVAKGDVCIGPLGNMSPRRPTANAKRDLFLAASGPLTHLLIGLIGISICMSTGQRPQISWLNPVTPPPLEGRWEWSQIGMSLWVINWCLTLLRLLPTQPLDGHLMLLSGIRLSRPELPGIWAGLIVRHLCLLVGALALGFSLGAFLWGTNPGLIPDWIIPASIAIFLVWGAVSRLSSIESVDDFNGETPYRTPSSGYSSPTAASARRGNESPHEPAADSRYITPGEDFYYDDETHGNQWNEEDSWDEFSEPAKDPVIPDPQKIDAILDKIHTSGSASLTLEERELLAKASEFLRQKRANPDKT
jgi:hypothetical protein